jgi:hypothetical protein
MCSSQAGSSATALLASTPSDLPQRSAPAFGVKAVSEPGESVFVYIIVRVPWVHGERREMRFWGMMLAVTPSSLFFLLCCEGGRSCDAGGYAGQRAVVSGRSFDGYAPRQSGSGGCPGPAVCWKRCGLRVAPVIDVLPPEADVYQAEVCCEVRLSPTYLP